MTKYICNYVKSGECDGIHPKIGICSFAKVMEENFNGGHERNYCEKFDYAHGVPVDEPITEPEPKKYRLLKDLNPWALEKVGICTGGVLRYIDYFKNTAIGTNFFVSGQADFIITSNQNIELWRYLHAKPYRTEWYLDKGFIEEIKPKVFYHVGQNIMSVFPSKSKYQIIRIDRNTVCLLSLDNWCVQAGCRTTVKDPLKITKEEMQKIWGNNDLIPIEGT